MRTTRALLYVLPNLFTVSSIFCGLYAILEATGDRDPARFGRAAAAILFAVLFDAADGRVARMTRTQSRFGVQLDSLADVISFGVAPAVLAIRWALAPLGALGLAAAFFYTACGAMRLARFNVQAAVGAGGATRAFTGLPIPMAAAALCSLVLLHGSRGDGELLHNQELVAATVGLLGLLMVSRVRYRTFKKLRANWRTLGLLLALAGMVLVAAWRAGFSLVLVSLCAAYIGLGLAEELLRLVRRRSRPTADDPDDPHA